MRGFIQSQSGLMFHIMMNDSPRLTIAAEKAPAAAKKARNPPRFPSGDSAERRLPASQKMSMVKSPGQRIVKTWL